MTCSGELSRWPLVYAIDLSGSIDTGSFAERLKHESMTSPSQHWNPEQYAAKAGFVAELGAPVVELLAPQRGERILDLGCGDGALTVKLLGAGRTVVGIDASPEMISAAQERGLDARVMDGRELPFSREFDAVFLYRASIFFRGRPRYLEMLRLG